MKKSILTALSGLLLTTSVNAQQPQQGPDVLVAYYSLSGNTEKIANKIAEQTGADVFKIELVTPYPESYREQTELAKKELSEGYLPPIKGLPENMDKYNVVFIGSPVWWGTMATPVRTFLASGVLKGKKVIPFVTHGGGGADKSFTDTAELCKDCDVNLNGWSGYGSMSLGLSKWVKNNLNNEDK